MMLQNQIEAAQSAQNSDVGTSFSFSENNTKDIEALKEINVSLSPEAILQVAGIALLLGLLSSAAGLVYILRYEPMKILSERN
jgi:putative ABC transport system permease protein